MKRATIETLEPRQLLSVVNFPTAVADPNSAALSQAQVQTILAQAISQAKPSQVAVVVDREGQVLGMLGANGVTPSIRSAVLDAATMRARTAAFFQSRGESFSTRTARFIVQDHFPVGIRNQPGGPLYGVEFSSLANSDVLLPSQTPAISGDPGGIPLYVNNEPVGGIGVAGDFHDNAARPELIPVTQGFPSQDPHRYNANPNGLVYERAEEKDFDEAVAQAGAKGFLPREFIRATNIFVGGIRLPFTAEAPAKGHASQSFGQLISSGAAMEFTTAPGGGYSIVPAAATVTHAGEQEKITPGAESTFGTAGLVRDRKNTVQSPVTGQDTGVPHTDPQDSDPIVGAADIGDNDPNGLTSSDVITIIKQAVAQSLITRAGIRKPNGVHAVVHVAVVDLEGNVLGAFRMEDGTNFSYDVAVQKARTALFFSDNTHAFSPRAIGFMAQRYFPPGITRGDTGPLFHLQNMLDELASPFTLKPQFAGTQLANGITIFPGGEPLYKNGVLVGGVGVSGDGVDQDDIISYAGTKGFRPPDAIRCDNLGAQDATNFILRRLRAIEQIAPLGYDPTIQAEEFLLKNLQKLRLPYVKFPRLPIK